MARFDRREIDLTVPNPAATVSGVLNLASPYARITGISALAVGTDVLTKIQVVDADSTTVYLDAADRDYKTARVNLLPTVDVTTTGLTFTPVDSTGAAITAAKGGGEGLMVVKSPLTISYINGGTAADTVNIRVYYERLNWSKSTTTITIPNPAATTEVTVNVPGKYVRLVGLQALLTGADATTKLRVRDADNLVAFLDAAAVDYTSAKKYQIINDDTATGLSWTPVDATGAAHVADIPAVRPILRAPLKVAAIDNGTAAESYAVTLYTEQ